MDEKIDSNDEESPKPQERGRRRAYRSRSPLPNLESQKKGRNRSRSPGRLPQNNTSRRSVKPSDLTAEKLCQIAISDLYHDFKGDEEAIQTASFSIPTKGIMCRHDEEERLLQKLLGLTRDGENHFIEPNKKEDTLLKDYNCAFINKPYYEKGKNNLNDAFQTVAGKGDLFLIVDFFYSGFKEALSNLKRTKDGPTLYWVQNRQTLYDPAGKAHAESDAGKIMFRDNPRVKFAWENTTSRQFLPHEIYPSWKQSWGKPIQPSILANQNELFFSKNNMDLILQSNAENDYDSQEALCIVETPQKKTVIMSKEMASKTSTSISQGEYAILEDMLRKTLQGASIQSNSSIKTVRNTYNQHHVAAKRLGDQSQALSCLKAGQSLHYMKGGQKDTITLNGINCFVTHDRVAMASAIAYQVPIVLYLYYDNTHFAMFIRNNLLDEITQKRFAVAALQKQMEHLQEERNAVGALYVEAADTIKKQKETLKEYDKSLNNFKNKIRSQLQSYQAKFDALSDDEPVRRKELLYQHFVFDLFKFVPYITAFLNLFEKSKKPVQVILDKRERILDDFDAKQQAVSQEFQKIQQSILKEQERQKTLGRPKTYDQIIDAFSNFLKDIQASIVELREMIGSIQDDMNFYLRFETAAEDMKKTCDGPEPDTIPIEHATNMEQSHMFEEEGPTPRQFIVNAEQFTLCSYLLKIKDMLHDMNSAFQNKDVQDFLAILRMILSKMKSQPQNDKKYNAKVDFLYKKFPELQPKNGGQTSQTSQTSRTRKNKKQNGGTKQVQAYRKEGILRSAFALLYAAWENGHPLKDSKNTKWDQAMLRKLYEKFNPNGHHVLVKGDLPRKDPDYYYYIPFVQEQIHDLADEDLLRMQQEIENALETIDAKESKAAGISLIIPKRIENRLYAFLEAKTSSQSFFQSSLGSLTAKQGSTKKLSKPKSVKPKSSKPIIKTIWNYVKPQKPSSSVLQPTSMIPQLVSTKKGGRTKKYKNKRRRKTKKRRQY